MLLEASFRDAHHLARLAMSSKVLSSACISGAQLTAINSRVVRRGVSSKRGCAAITNFAPASGDFSLSLPEGAAAGAIVLGARVFFIGLAKAGIGRRVEKYMAECEKYGVQTEDLFYTEDQPGDAWYLIGDWKPAKAGMSKHSDTTLVGILTTRARTAELIEECKQKNIEISDILSTDYAPSFITNEKKRFNEINNRLKEA